MKSDEQKLIDIIFDLALTIKDNPKYRYMTRSAFCTMIAQTLRENGFDTKPQGISWGILKT